MDTIKYLTEMLDESSDESCDVVDEIYDPIFDELKMSIRSILTKDVGDLDEVFSSKNYNYTNMCISMFKNYYIEGKFWEYRREYHGKITKLYKILSEKRCQLNAQRQIERENIHDSYVVKDMNEFGCIETIGQFNLYYFWVILSICFRKSLPGKDSLMREARERHDYFVKKIKTKLVRSSGKTYAFSKFYQIIKDMINIMKKSGKSSYIDNFHNNIKMVRYFQDVKKYRLLWEEYELIPLTLPAIWDSKNFTKCQPELREEIRQFLYIWKYKNMPKVLHNYVIDRIVDLHIIYI
tara:strand:+ start:1557 stop:2438 length:882 start_codon:yes stop_codon:yes gene_type:complete